jgi:glycosyltransferase involved in cell wall biosynthesis
MPDLASPRVSVCLLTYNRAEALRRSIESLLAQSYANFELIVNDDCSPDNTAEVCAEYAKKDQRIRYCRNEKNLRYAGNQNAAMARAQFELVAIVHDGDIYRTDCVEKWVEALLRNPRVGIVFNASDALDDTGKVAVKYRHPYPPVLDGRDMLDEMFRVYSSPIFGIVMVRKELALTAGRFDESYPILADVDMWMRILLRADVAYINEPLYQIYPREADHVNRGVNWAILLEQHRIFTSNAVRRFRNEPEEQKRVLLHLHRKYQMRLLRSCLWALRRGRWRLGWAGVRPLLGSLRGSKMS